ncbi:hypothetical protein FF011L_49190 [Roseimaritima multifibrata]|uniref:Transmembrane protein n=1 Tax=Roseimaritima multifibrata TaxID=1930274 RepID=A0A517MMK6_9BACT|nr:hypothetical protein FF011L_49190 [Roseimaritima multifibrata]
MFRRPSNRVSDFQLIRGVAPLLGICITFAFVATANAGFTSPYLNHGHLLNQQVQEVGRGAIVASASDDFQLGLHNSTLVLSACREKNSQEPLLLDSVVLNWSEAIDALSLGNLEVPAFSWDLSLLAASSPEEPQEVPCREMLVAGLPCGGSQDKESECGEGSRSCSLAGSGSSQHGQFAGLSGRKSSAATRRLIRGCATEMASGSSCAFSNSIQANLTLVSCIGTGVFSFLPSVGMSHRVYKTTGSLSRYRRDVVTVLCVPQAVCRATGAKVFGSSSHLKGEWI